MKQRPIAETRSAAKPITLPQRLVEVYALLASLARQRRAAAMKEADIPTQPAS